MNKKYLGWLLAIPALMGFGLTSCSDEEALTKQEISATQKVDVTFIAELGNTSRASLTFNENKELKFKWAEKDVISAVNAANGEFIGTLTVSKVLDDPRLCQFSGKLVLPKTGTTPLKFYYLGEKGKMEFDPETYLPVDINVDFSKQNGAPESLDDYDLLIGEKEYSSADNGKLGNIRFNRHFASAQFILKYQGEVLPLNGKTVTISDVENEENFFNAASLKYQTGAYTHYKGNIQVSPATNNFYVNLIPSKNAKMKFTVEMDNGEWFEGVKGEGIAEDTYYSNNLEPIVVEMKHTDGRDDKYDVKVIGKLNYPTDAADVEGNTINTTLSYEYTLADNLEAPTREGYEFQGWSATATSSVAITKVNFDNEEVLTKNVYAIWKQVYNYKVILKYDDGTEKPIEIPSTEATISVDLTKEDADINEPAFLGWREEGTTSPNSKTTWTLSKDKSEVTLVRAYNWLFIWVDEPSFGEAAVTYGKSAETGPTPKELEKSFPCDLSSNKWYKNMTKEGYTFLGWEYDNKMVGNNGTYLSSDVVASKGTTTVTQYGEKYFPVYIYAKWEKLPDPNNIETSGYRPGEFNK